LQSCDFRLRKRAITLDESTQPRNKAAQDLTNHWFIREFKLSLEGGELEEVEDDYEFDAEESDFDDSEENDGI